MRAPKLKDGQRLHIEPANPADAAEILLFLNLAAGESDNLSSTPGDFSLTVEQEANFLAHEAASPNSVTLCGKVDKRVMAIASLRTPPLARIAHTSELSLVVGRLYWNKGVGTAMLEELLRFARENPVLRMLYLGVRDGNEAAMALYRRFGFAETGRLPRYFHIDDAFYDEIFMSIWL